MLLLLRHARYQTQALLASFHAPAARILRSPSAPAAHDINHARAASFGSAYAAARTHCARGHRQLVAHAHSRGTRKSSYINRWCMERQVSMGGQVMAGRWEAAATVCVLWFTLYLTFYSRSLLPGARLVLPPLAPLLFCHHARCLPRTPQSRFSNTVVTTPTWQHTGLFNNNARRAAAIVVRARTALRRT